MLQKCVNAWNVLLIEVKNERTLTKCVVSLVTEAQEGEV